MGAPKSVLRFFLFKNISQSGGSISICVCVCVWGGVCGRVGSCDLGL